MPIGINQVGAIGARNDYSATSQLPTTGNWLNRREMVIVGGVSTEYSWDGDTWNPVNLLNNTESNRAKGGSIVISANVTINATNQLLYDGKVLAFSAEFTVTLAQGLATDFGFGVLPPSSGNANIARASGVTLNGGTTTIARTAAANAAFTVVQDPRAANAYIVTGA